METPVQTCCRLVGALEELVAQEAVCLSARDFGSVSAVQQRCAPIVEHLARHGPRVADERLRHRIMGVIRKRAESDAWLSLEIARVRNELDGLDTQQRLMAQVGPAYGGGRAAARSRLSAVG